ncbi:MAG: pirin family protein, partial [Clostridia bacterium]|nr:pirin family protein [Clostridia bacterium]
RLNEPVAWYGSIVMNNKQELIQAYREIDNDTFIRQQAKYENKRG